MRLARLLPFLLVLTAAPAMAGIVSCTRATNGFAMPDAYLTTGTCTLSSSYAAGGETFGTNNTLNDVGSQLCGSGFRKPLTVLLGASVGGYLWTWDGTNNKIVGRVPVGLAASSIVAGANNTIVKNAGGTGLEVSGTGTAFQAPAVQITTATNVSSIAVPFIAFCQ